MAMRYPGGLIAPTPVNANYPSGVWTPSQSLPYQQQNVWTRDQYWPYTTLLLQGNGTNGAQNNTFLDSSSNTFSITRNGNTTQGSFTPYEANGYWSNYFDGSGDYLSFPNNSAFAFGTGAFTIEFWVNSNGLNDSFILSGRAGIGTLHITYGGFGGTTPSCLRYVGSSTITSGSVLISNNLWNHCAIVRDGSNNITLYVNGVSVGTGTDTTNYTATSGTWYINANDVGPTSAQAGYISNLRIVKGTAVYTSAFTPSTSPLTAITNTSLLTCQSNRFIDNSASPLTITVNGNPSVQAFQPFPGATTWSASVLGGSGYFDGSGDYLTTNATQAIPATGDFTIEAWVYPTVSGSGRNIVSQGTNGSSGRLQLNVDTGNTLQFAITSTVVNSTGTVTPNAWNYVAVTRTGSSVAFYINGAAAGTATVSGTVQNTALWVGSEWAGDPYRWLGYMAGVRISNTIRSISAVTAPFTSDANTVFLCNFTNAGIFDSAMMNDLETVGNAQVSTSIVKYGTGSMAFDGSGDYLQTNNTKILTFNGTNTFTVEAWIYQTAYVSTSGYMNNVIGDLTPTSAVALYWSIGMNASNQPGVRWYDGSVKTADASTALTLNQWNHVAWVVTAGVLKIFINGVQATLTGTTTLTTPSTTVGYLIVGADRGYYMTAYIDDLRITKGVARYISNFTPPPARMPQQ